MRDAEQIETLKQVAVGALIGALVAAILIIAVLYWPQPSAMDMYYETCRQKGWPKC